MVACKPFNSTTGKRLVKGNDIKFVCWNVEGIRNLISNQNNLEFIKCYDVIGLVETWCSRVSELRLEGYICFEKIKCRLGVRGRFPGGIALFI